MKNYYDVATFNIRFDNAKDDENAWSYRKEHVLGMLRYYAWDVIGMQEVCGNQLDDLAALSEYSFEGIGREDDHASEHCPVFYKKELFEREDGGTFWLSTTPEVSSKSWGSDCKRVCTWVRLRDKRNGTRFAFLNTHLDHISEEARFQGARMITSFIRTIGSDIPVLLTGDFNAFPDERCYHEIANDMNNSRLVARNGHYGPIGTFTGFDSRIPSEALKQIDYIFVNDKVSVYKTRTVVDSQNHKYPSDHFPIAAAVQF